MLTDNVIKIHEADEKRLDELLFLKDEVKFFKKAMSNHFLKLVHQHALDIAEKLSKDIIVMENQVDSLLAKLNLLEEELTILVREETNEHEEEILAFNNEVEIELQALEVDMKSLKNELFEFFEEINISEREYEFSKGIKRVRELRIQNLKCGGCASTIKSELIKIEGVSEVEVDEHASLVKFVIASSSKLPLVKDKLNELGYPIEGANNGLGKKAKSYVSCMKGRMSDQ
jgi:copper chaperone CopZ